MDPTTIYLKSLDSIRDRTGLLLKYPQHLQSFTLDLDKLDVVVDMVLNLIKRDYASPKDIPMHSRWRHFNVGNIQRIDYLLSAEWMQENQVERVRKLIDLFVVSVLLDAGAGDSWKYQADDSRFTGKVNDVNMYNRSEGLAIASLDWFLKGGFSSDHSEKTRCDAKGLEDVTVETLESIFQVSSSNPLVGAEGRCRLLNKLGTVCNEFPNYFHGESEIGRPGNLVDYLMNHPTVKIQTQGKMGATKTIYTLDISVLWDVVTVGFGGIWPPTRTTFNDHFLGDVWPLKAMSYIAKENEPSINSLPIETHGLVCFHKLSQWLTYSLMEPLSLINIHFENVDKMTGLAEYRNGGLFVDMDVIHLNDDLKQKHCLNGENVPTFQVFDDTVVEWRALTVALLDLVGDKVRRALGMSVDELPLVKVLEAGTWKAGREIAAKLRPDSKGPPIKIISDGTVF